MTPAPAAPPARLVDRSPTLTGEEIASFLVPPRQFLTASLDSYRPDPDYPSQVDAVNRMRAFASQWAPKTGGFFSRKKVLPTKPGIYLDGELPS